jgi:hypothetical protein
MNKIKYFVNGQFQNNGPILNYILTVFMVLR